ncbi:MAG: DUF6265 family protein [Bacteroidota bacterium]
MNKFTVLGLLAISLLFFQCSSKDTESSATSVDENQEVKVDPDAEYIETETPNVRIKNKFPDELIGMDKMLGTWTYTNKEGKVHEETWSLKDSGLPKGIAQQKKGGTVSFEEQFAIEKKDENIVLWITPQEQQAVPFKLIFQNGRKWLWLNQDHDFPKQIEYNLVSDTELKVKAMGAENNAPKTIEFTMTKQG